MAQLHDIYSLVKLINEMAIKQEKDENTSPYGSYTLATPSKIDVKIRFQKRRFRRDRSRRKVQLITGLAYEKKYIKTVTSHDIDIDPGYQILTNGWDIIERSFFGIIPKGLWLAWAKKNSDFYNVVIGFVSGIIIGGIGAIIAIIKR